MAENTAFRTTTQHMLKESKEYARQTLMGGLSGFESPIGLDRNCLLYTSDAADE